MHTSTASFMIPPHVVLAGAARVCALARRAYARKRSARGAARRHGILYARGALRRNEILEHISPVLGSGLGKKAQVCETV